MPRFKTFAIVAAGLAGALSTPSSAQTVGQQASEGAMAMGRCVVGKTTGDDRVLVVRWLGASMSSAPQLADMVSVDAEAKEQVDREMADLFVRLFTQDCAEQARPLVQGNDMAAIQIAFGMLGEMAMNEMMADPQAQASMMSYIEHIPADALDPLLAE